MLYEMIYIKHFEFLINFKLNKCDLKLYFIFRVFDKNFIRENFINTLGKQY